MCRVVAACTVPAALGAPQATQAASLVPATDAGSTTGVCTPPRVGAPCATGGLASPGNAEPALSLALGNPIHLATGNKYQLEVDLPPNPSAPGLELVRHYNALGLQGGVLGRNWALSYDTTLERRGQQWLLRQADGRIRPIDAPLPQGSGHAWHLPDGRSLHFDARGRLERIALQRRPIVHIHRHTAPQHLAGLIDRVTSTHGYTLQFHYGEHAGQPVLHAVDTPLGRFRYEHDTPPPESAHRSARLAGVHRPDGMLRTYHHEAVLQGGNPYALTGISIRPAGGKPYRLATWRYDRHGRVMASRLHGRRDAEWHIDYVQPARASRPGLTRVRDAAGTLHTLRFERHGDAYRSLDGARYDTEGRLMAIGPVQLQRDALGGLAALAVHEPGWPGLTFERQYSPSGLAWHSRATGRSVLLADELGRPARLQHANGDTLHIRYGPHGRPHRIDESGGTPAREVTTQLLWRGTRLTHIEHPAETELRQYDAAGQLTRRVVMRPLAAPHHDATHGHAVMRLEDAFHYDARGRLLRHDLPEGGALHYAWRNATSGGTLAALHWEDARGRRHAVIDSPPGEPGYRYGNGLALVTSRPPGGHADTLHLVHGDALIWRQRRRYDPAGTVALDEHAFPQYGHHERVHFVHDARGRIQGALYQQPTETTRWWYAWHPDGRLAALSTGTPLIERATATDSEPTTARAPTPVTIPLVPRDASGLPQRIGALSLRYGPNRRLQQVKHAGSETVLADYRHNAFGHRIAKRHGGTDTHFLYAHDRLVAEARAPRAGLQPVVTRRYVYAGAAVVGLIDYAAGDAPQLYAVHADLTGAPRLVTDASRRLRWLARYSPTGQAERIAGDLEFPLRLPGQYADPETGWHDNLLRTYVPQWGQYLEPDPLGPMPGSDAFGYAGQQPWRYVDPWGLLLFAFDGTRYSADTGGNVQRLAQLYRDGAAHYHSGPGNSYFLDWDAVVAWRAGRILENQWQALLTALEHAPPDRPVPIDILGFSRGAALARHFGNRIAAHVHNGVFSVSDPLRGQVSACVDLRFMGLFDSVAQFGIGGSHNHLYDFTVAEMWSWVAHAVALHERRWAFPLLGADAGGAGNVVESPFVGVHADIGGGAILREAAPGADSPEAADNAASGPADAARDADLAKVALAWMHWQALAANVDFADLQPDDTQVRSPVLRDLRSPVLRSVQDGDRALQSPSGHTRLAYQDDDARLGRATRTHVETFIRRADAWRSHAGEQVGTVDMTGYEQWLRDTLGWAP